MLKDDLIRLNKIEAELKRRYDGDSLKRYNTGKVKHKKQIAFHKCKVRNRWVFGGNRTGKTECGAAECVYMARGVHPYRKNRDNVFGWVVSLSTQVQRDVAQDKILKYLNPDWIVSVTMLSGRKDSLKDGVIDQIRIKNVFGGVSTIGFKSCDQGREKFQGSSLDFVWFDEEPPKDIYDECRMRVLDKKGDIFGTMTPLKGLTFIYDEIYLKAGVDKNVWCEFISWEDNPYLNKEEVKMLSATLSEKELNARKYGRFTSGSGPVYPEFDENVHVIEPFTVPYEWQDTLSIDPGLKNPLSCHWYAVDFDGNVYVIEEHFAAGLSVEEHAEIIRQKSDKIGWHRDMNGKISALIDSAANQRTLASLKSVSELFFDYGINVNANVNKDLFSGINRVKSYFKNNKIFIFKNCVNLISELKTYWWGNGDAPVKKDDHALDELRYYVMSKPVAAETPVKLNAVQRDKLRLIKRLRNKGGRY